MSQENDFKSLLEKIVSQYYETTQKPLLLSQVPEKLKAEGLEYSKDSIHPGQKLRKFIEAVCPDSFVFVADANNPLVIGILPVNSDTGRYSKEPWIEEKENPKGTEGTRFDRAIFSAFAKPLTASRRFLGNV